MKKLGVLFACLAIALMGVGLAEAGKSSKSKVPCEVGFGLSWGETIVKAQSYGQVTNVKVETGKYLCGKVYFTAEKSSKRPKLYKGKEYYLENCCGKISGPYEVKKHYGGGGYNNN